MGDFEGGGRPCCAANQTVSRWMPKNGCGLSSSASKTFGSCGRQRPAMTSLPLGPLANWNLLFLFLGSRLNRNLVFVSIIPTRPDLRLQPVFLGVAIPLMAKRFSQHLLRSER